MATPTTRLKLKKQALSENLNTWGLSNGINGVIDQVDVLAGYLEVDLGTSTSYTFGTTNYSVVGNEHAYRAVKFTGTPASGVTVNIPAVDDFKFIENATGQTITFSNGSTTATLANTFTGYLRTNGSSSITVLVLPDGVNVQTVAANIASVNTVAGISSDVTTVAGISSAVTGVNGISSDVSGVNAIASNVTTVAGISSAVSGVNAIASDVTAVNTDPLKTSIGNVSGNATNINAVNSNSANINSVAGIASDVTTVAGIASDVTGVNAIASDVSGVNAVASNVTTVAGVSANVTTVAGISSDVTGVNAIASDVSGVNAIASDVTGVNTISSAVTAVNSNSSNVNNVSTNIANVNNVGGSITSVNTVANNLTDVNAFGNTYQISTNNPTTDGGGNPLSSGDLAYVTSASKLRVYNGSSWEDAGSATNGTVDRHSYVATANQTTFPATGSISYNPNFVDVYLNGIKLVNGIDVTVSSGSNIVLATGAAVNDTVDVVAYGTFALADMYTKAQSDNRYVQPSGNVATATLATTATNVAGGAAQGILYQSATSTTAHLAAGAAGTVLQSNGTGSAPTWVASSTIATPTGVASVMKLS
tara:strand:- start:9887 stop:11662 length:1776 start_codon:yes stop_codon:yes gene_type:complete